VDDQIGRKPDGTKGGVRVADNEWLARNENSVDKINMMEYGV